MRRRAKPAKAKVEAKSTVARESSKNDGARVRDLEKRLAEALKGKADALRDKAEARDQQTATSEILKVISRMPSDVQPVFDMIAESAARLCDAIDVTIFQVDSNVLRVVVHRGPIPSASVGQTRPMVRETTAGRAVLDRRTIHVADVQAETDEYPEGSVCARSLGHRTILVAPLLHVGEAIGAIAVRRTDVRPFTERQVDLLHTFADQAVIAIENVRLFTETKEALDQQTATGEILRIIASSPTDVQPVFDAIVAAGRRLSGGLSCTLRLLDGEVFRLVAFTSTDHIGDEAMRSALLMPSGEPLVAQVMRTRVPVFVADTEIDPLADAFRERARARGFRSVISVPLLRKGHVMGLMAVTRQDPGMFAPPDIALLETFADQAVIAIENARLFNELQASNRELTTALDKQTATSDILRVISRSQTDVQPVFDAIVASAVRLLGGYSGTLARVAGGQIELAAFTSTDADADAALRASYPRSLESEFVMAIRERVPLNVAAAQTDPRLPQVQRTFARVRGFQSLAAVPLLHHDEAVGAIMVTRREAGGFTDDEIALLQTFADQAVIAIENVRLFKELGARNRDLSETLDRQTATSDLLRIISRSQTDLKPVFGAIMQSAVRLCGADMGAIFRIEDAQLVPVELSPDTPHAWSVIRQAYPRPVDTTSLIGRAVVEARVLLVPDLLEPGASHGITSIPRGIGFRSQLSVPVIRDGQPIGVIGLTRREPGPFSDAAIDLVKTFADQAVIAIENARLLGELQAQTKALTRSVDRLTALGDVGRAVSSSLDLDTVLTTIVDRAVQLSGTDGGTIFEYDEGAEEFTARATLNANASQSALLRATRLRRGEGAVGQMAVTREPFQIPDIATEGAYESRIRGPMLASGTRSVLAIPLLHEERLVGGLVVTRRAAGTFTDDVVALLRTFATQSALAIQNARLFREIEDKSRQLEVAGQHKSEFLANMSHELRTPLNAIIGFSEVLGERMFGELNEKQDEYLKDIYASGQHLLSLINDILDLSKIEAGRMELEVADFNLPATLDNALTLVRERAGRRGIALGLTVDERLEQIRADERKVRQVVLNLLSNAIKFTPEGGRIEVRAVPVDGNVEISVSDTGVGIAPEDQEAIFEEFRQVGTASKKVEGTGLGLALSRKFVELHGGKIWVKSQVGAGSTFTFTIPMRVGA